MWSSKAEELIRSLHIKRQTESSVTYPINEQIITNDAFTATKA